jgi:hypothetical protein
VLYISSKRNLTIDGNGARLNLPPGGMSWQSIGFWVLTSTGTTIRDLTMVGDNHLGGTNQTDWSRQNNHGIIVLNSFDTLIQRVHIRRVWGDCLNIRHVDGHEGEWNDGVTFRDSSCRLNGRSGVIVHDARNVRIVNNVFDDIGYAVVGMEPEQHFQGASDVVIRGNTIGSYSLTPDYRGYVLYACDAPANSSGPSTIRNVTFTGNTVAGGNRNGIDNELTGLFILICGDRGNRENFTITNNTAASTVRGPAMRFTNVRGVTVTGNDQPLSSGALATFPDSTNVTYDG